ncbi:hypothetical protein HanPSC8_Chr13g0553381 [Helianthus annuus]|nr:hypothetical protein HanPSC8_Chr13g0553381 [Helianthus annuus]
MRINIIATTTMFYIDIYDVDVKSASGDNNMTYSIRCGHLIRSLVKETAYVLRFVGWPGAFSLALACISCDGSNILISEISSNQVGYFNIPYNHYSFFNDKFGSLTDHWSFIVSPA